jgi:hypothetical protein
MSIAALITEGIGPGATIPLLLTEGLGIGQAVTTTFDHGGIRGLSKKEMRRQHRAAQLAEAQRAREWEALNADRAGLRSDIKELLSPTPKPVVIEPAPVVAAVTAQPAAQPAPQIIPIKPVFAEIPDDDEEHDLELILLSL